MRRIALAFILVLSMSSLIAFKVQSASAAFEKPSIPEFTVELIDSSYNIPATTTTDPYTGQIVTHPSQCIEARTIEIRIKNVPFSPFEIKNGSNTYTVQFYYNIRFKGHFEEEWREPYNPNLNGYPGRDSGPETVISLQGEYSHTEGLKLTPDRAGFYATFPPNAQVDFQVEAMIGYIHHVVALPFSADVFEGETSGWSETQTITVDAASTVLSPDGATATPTEGATDSDVYPQTRQLTAILGVVIIAIVVGVTLGLLYYFKDAQRSRNP
ncbi:MAG: hypothetical protein NWE94_00900 [Candidatus Bathyarchaeota archaeon]|nr:hypothetical protein [Candidatus Bathyarchaeota archaeon]